MDKYNVSIKITRDMLEEAKKVAPSIRVNRTKASPYDAEVGVIGEFIFAEWFLQNWKLHDPYSIKGKVDFFDEIEIKTSAFPFSKNLNLLVREDYANTTKRRPKFYIQVIIDLPYAGGKIKTGLNCILAGFATREEVEIAEKKDFGSKYGGKGGYRCKYIPIHALHPMNGFKKTYQDYAAEQTF